MGTPLRFNLILRKSVTTDQPMWYACTMQALTVDNPPFHHGCTVFLLSVGPMCETKSVHWDHLTAETESAHRFLLSLEQEEGIKKQKRTGIVILFNSKMAATYQPTRQTRQPRGCIACIIHCRTRTTHHEPRLLTAGGVQICAQKELRQYTKSSS
jgi:hypothetical protein